MFLKIGELARRTGLTVRALRHYGDIGLLVPSEPLGRRLPAVRPQGTSRGCTGSRRCGGSTCRWPRSRRLLNDANVATTRALAAVVDAAGDAARPRDPAGLGAAHAPAGDCKGQLQASEEPAVDDWLVALESMVAGAKYFSDDELAPAEDSQRDGFADAVAPERAAADRHCCTS
jgi:hypothetical protein